jgi:hypothetical protein
MGSVKIEYDKPRNIDYIVYIDGKRYNKRDAVIDAQKHTIVLDEYNYALGWFWWIMMIIAFAFGEADDCKGVRRFKKRIEFEFENCGGDITIYITPTGDISQIDGVGNYNIISNVEADISKKVNKRIRIYKTVVLTICLSFLAVCFGLLIFF